MLVTQMPPGSNLNQWLYNFFSQMKTQYAAENASTTGGGKAAEPIISSPAASAAGGTNIASGMPDTGANVSLVTALYGTMMLQAEVAFPGSLVSQSQTADSPQTASQASAHIVAASQAAGAYGSTNQL